METSNKEQIFEVYVALFCNTKDGLYSNESTDQMQQLITGLLFVV